MQRLAKALGVVLVVVAVAAIGGAAWIGATLSGWGYALALLVLGVGVATRAERVRRGAMRGVARAGLAVFVLSAAGHGCAAANARTVRATTTGGSARTLGFLVDEADVALLGTRMIRLTGHFQEVDTPILFDSMRAAYKEMAAAEGAVPSPFLATYLGLEDSQRSDVIVVEAVREPKKALVFLHGFAGSFTLPCWQIAQAAAKASMITYCPSMGPRGDWWTAEGRRTLDRTVAMLHARGIDRIYLAGLSNGAVGVARQAPAMRGTFQGVILISGGAAAPSPGVPVLVVQGRDDRMMPAFLAQKYAQDNGGTYVELAAGHFAMLVRGEEARKAIADWLAAH